MCAGFPAKGRRRFEELLRDVLGTFEPAHTGLEVAVVFVNRLPRDEALAILERRREAVAARRGRIAREFGDLAARRLPGRLAADTSSARSTPSSPGSITRFPGCAASLRDVRCTPTQGGPMKPRAAVWICFVLALSGSGAHAEAVSEPHAAAAGRIAPYDPDKARAASQIQDPEAATQAYLDAVSPERRALTRAYANGHYVLWIADLAIAAAAMIDLRAFG